MTSGGGRIGLARNSGYVTMGGRSEWGRSDVVSGGGAEGVVVGAIAGVGAAVTDGIVGVISFNSSDGSREPDASNGAGLPAC